MLEAMKTQQGSVVRLDYASQSAALAGIETGKVIKEQPIDKDTARLIMNLWRALVVRAQIVKEVGVRTFTLDGTSYRIWQGGRSAKTGPPKAGSVLDQALMAAEYLESAVAEQTSNPELAFDLAQDLMTYALELARQKQPCLAPP
jgi:hypothetical protein